MVWWTGWAHAHDGHQQLIACVKHAIRTYIGCSDSMMRDLSSAYDYRSIFISEFVSPDASDITSLIHKGMRMENPACNGLGSLVPTAGAERLHVISALAARTSRKHTSGCYSHNTIQDHNKYMTQRFAWARRFVILTEMISTSLKIQKMN